MYNKPVKHWQPLPKIFKIAIIILLLLGLFFRFSNLAERPYWHDEAYTLLRASGHTIAEMTHNLFDGAIVNRDAVLRYQKITPKKTPFNALNSIATEEPHRAPLYYLMMRLWLQWFGDSVVVARLLSVLISLLILPSLYWFCVELFSQPITAWIALALTAVSPFHVYYAQEIREYSLWTVTLLLMNAALLRAVRTRAASAWFLYTVTFVLSFYTSVLTGLVAIAHIIYVLTLTGQRRTGQTIAFFQALMVAGLATLPWLIVNGVGFSRVKEANAWMNQAIPLPSLIEQWFGNLILIFFRDHFTRSWQWLLAFTIASIVGVAGFFLWRRSHKPTWLFLAGLVLIPFLALAIPDVVLGGIRSINRRYLVPSVLGIQITVAFFLATQLIQTHTKPWKQMQWRLITVLLVNVGVISCLLQIVRPQKTDDQAIAEFINQAAPAIVISNEASLRGGGTIGDVLVLSHLVNAQTQFQLVIPPQVPIIPPRSQVFLYKPFELLKQQIRSQCIPKPIYQDKLFECQRVQPVTAPFISENS